MKIPNRANIWEKIKRFLNNNWVLIVIILFALGIRIYFFKNTQTEINQDSYWFSALAKSILKGRYEIEGQFWGVWQPFYPFLMVILSSIVHDFILSGKIISLIAGVASIPLIYLLWVKLESKEVALVTCWLIAVNEVEWYYSMHVFSDTLFLFFLASSFLLLFMAKEDFKWLPFLAISLGLASLTRGEGYLLAFSLIITLLYWNKDYITKRANLKGDKLKFIAASLVIYIAMAAPWQIYKYFATGEIIPTYLSQWIARSGHTGLSWFLFFPKVVRWPIFLISLVGICLTWKDKEKYLPFYLYIILFSILHMWHLEGSVKYTMQTLPIFLGWFSIGILSILAKISSKHRIKYALLILLILYPFIPNMVSVRRTENRGDLFEVDKVAMNWFEANTEKDAKIVGGDTAIYGYYTPRHNIPNSLLYQYTDIYMKMGKIDLNTYHQQPYLPVIAFIIEKDIHYLIAYGSTTPWLFDATKLLKDDFRLHQFILKNKIVILSPLKRFEKNNQIVYIYRVDWEEI